MIPDSLKQLPFISDTLNHKIEVTMSGQETFFTLENPLWYIITIIISGVIAVMVSHFQKKRETITEAKKLFLEQRLEAHSKIFKLYSESKVVINLNPNTEDVYHKIFESYNKMNDWYDELLLYSVENQVFLSKNVLKQINVQTNLRKHLEYLYKNKLETDRNLITFASKYYKDLDGLLEDLGNSIAQFFENEINLDYKFGSLEQKELKESQKILYRYSLIKDNFKNTGKII